MPERNFTVVLGFFVTEPEHRDTRVFTEAVGVEIREEYITLHLVVSMLLRNFIEKIVEISPSTADRFEFEWQVVERYYLGLVDLGVDVIDQGL